MRLRRRRDQRLHLGDQRPAPLDRGGDAGARRGRRRRWHRLTNSALGSGHVVHAVGVELEAADLVGRAEPVLHGPHHPQRRGAVALDLQHDVDDVLERARPGDGPVLGHVTDEQGRHRPGLGHGHQRGRRLADLGDPARDAVDLGAGHRLHRIDDQHVRARPRRRWRARPTRSVSATRNRPGLSEPMRAARLRTCAGDSSPVTSSTREPASASRAAAASSSVDLPTPGSPATRTTAPGTRPPPSTRSSSPDPVTDRRRVRAVDLRDRPGLRGPNGRGAGDAAGGGLRPRDLVHRCPTRYRTGSGRATSASRYRTRSIGRSRRGCGAWRQVKRSLRQNR